ncbi:hypothetical protein NRA66_18600 [Acinetobacter baumannii]|nr:hypothetical protein [Acinetobacter baumannii]MDC5551444.1 hypothetical protein [Acinetobacter baumannii]MDC5572394.1 hypothetical protein [Acinetobacter baumannii]
MNIWWNIDIKDGVVSHDSISWIDDNFVINEDTVFDLSEDLLQIYLNNKKLDVGWYPALEVEGFFRVVLIKDMNWESPIIEKECRDIKSLKDNISNIISNNI